jgi:hypothetical protein
MTINWREKFTAAGIHFLVTAALAGIAAAIVFFVWFPNGLADVIGGRTLFLIVIGVDIALGPLLSLAIYSSTKTRKQLIIDYSIIGAFQLAALVYGLYVVALSRPAFVVYHGQRLEIVTAIELADEDLLVGTQPIYRSRPWIGPLYASVKMPTNEKERGDLVFSAVLGKDAQLMPKYFQSYDATLDDLKAHCEAINGLNLKSEDQATFDAAVKSSKLPQDALCRLQTRHRFGFGMVLIEKQSGKPLRFLNFDPTTN